MSSTYRLSFHDHKTWLLRTVSFLRSIFQKAYTNSKVVICVCMKIYKCLLKLWWVLGIWMRDKSHLSKLCLTNSQFNKVFYIETIIKQWLTLTDSTRNFVFEGLFSYRTAQAFDVFRKKYFFPKKQLLLNISFSKNLKALSFVTNR